MNLRPISADEVLLQHATTFPFSATYLSAEKGDGYFSDRYQWNEVVSSEDDAHDPVVGIICLDKTHRNILPNSLHISVFEVRSDLQRHKLGTRIMQHVISLASADTTIRVVTLMLRTPDLFGFYRRLGFRLSSAGARTFARLYVR